MNLAMFLQQFHPAPVGQLILNIVIVLIVGVVIWALYTYAPIGQPFKNIIAFVIVILIVLWLLQSFGLFKA